MPRPAGNSTELFHTGTKRRRQEGKQQCRSTALLRAGEVGAAYGSGHTDGSERCETRVSRTAPRRGMLPRAGGHRRIPSGSGPGSVWGWRSGPGPGSGWGSG
ncbi:hypothetical protein EK904_015068 [Melospiza melodia maxima]|nr:hypothetical protein EK904_015068 [Melospiza melodia maxima]